MKLVDDAPTPLEDELAGRLAAWDDALAAGNAPDGSDSVTAPVELHEPLARGLGMLRRLNGMRRSKRSAGADDAVQIGQRFGRFFVRRLLGRGGFASVFLAYDPQLGREVAIKLPHPEALVTPELRERFRIEAQAAAALDHPNLVAVFEADAIGPICYLVTAYCAGGSLAQWLRGQSAPVPIALAAEWIAQLADGVAHAHARGILHRDLKPGNILLTEDSSAATLVKVADFGLAKPVETDANLTRTGAVIGTPNYMSPEQTGGKLTASPGADIYALGAILYELLVGRPPFVADSPIEVLQLVRDQEPIAPRKLRPAIPRDLETICLKCLQKEPVRRYESAASLADDLRRFLAHEPICARPVGSRERAGRWVRRNPLAATLLLALAVALVGGFAGIVSQWRRADTLAIQNGQERDAAVRERDRADRNLTRAKNAVEHLSKLGGEIALQPGMDRTRHAVYEEILTYYRSLLDEQGDDPALKLETAGVWFKIGAMRYYLGQYAEADHAYSQGEGLVEQLLAVKPDDAALRSLRADAYLWHGHVLRQKNGVDHPTAMTAYDRAIDLAGQLMAEFHGNPQFQLTYSNALMNWATSRAATDLEAAEAAFRKAAVVQRQMMADRPEVINNRREYAFTIDEIGYIRYRQRQYSEAEAMFRESIDIRSHIASVSPKHPENWLVLARSRMHLGSVLRDTDRKIEADGEFREAEVALKRIRDDHPDVPQYRGQLAVSYRRRAQILRELERLEDAVELLRLAIKERDWIAATVRKEDPMDARRGELQHELGQCLDALDRPADAEQAFRAALADKPDNAVYLNDLGWLLATTGDAKVKNSVDAIRFADAAVKAAPKNANYWNTLAAAHLAASDAHAALAAVEHAASLRRDGNIDDWALFALIYVQLDDREHALEYHQRVAARLAQNPKAGRTLRRLHAEAAARLGT
jgi:tetratricopeptide (TPR) repeat protein